MLGGLSVDTAPDVGQLVRVGGQQWVVSRRSVSRQPRDELVAEASRWIINFRDWPRERGLPPSDAP